MSVDLPEPDGPITATSSPSVDRQRDAAQGVDGRVALAVAAGQVARGDADRRPAQRLPRGRRTRCVLRSCCGLVFGCR